MRVLDWICFVSSSLGIWHWQYPEEGCFQLPKHQGFATAGRLLGLLRLRRATLRVKMQSHSLIGGQPAAPRTQDCKFILFF